MVHELVVEFEIVNDRPVRFGLKPCTLAPPIAAAILEMVAEQLKQQGLLANIGAPRRYGKLELPGGTRGL